MSDIFYAYHTVTERPMYLGQHILFDENHQSGVYERVMDKLAIIQDIYSNPEKYHGTELEYPVVVALRELALEEVRKQLYPDYPSRMSCLYVSETLEEAVRWADFFISLGRPVFQIVMLKITGSKFTGDASKCFYATVNKNENLESAKQYWENRAPLPDKPQINEILVSGNIEVIKIVKEY